jgi:hypothetical protein
MGAIEKLTGTDLCAIIKTCYESGVKRIVLPGVIISFTGDTPVMSYAPTKDHNVIEQIESEALSQIEQETNEERLSRLMLENPVEYERLVLNGDLVAKDLADEADDRTAQ